MMIAQVQSVPISATLVTHMNTWVRHQEIEQNTDQHEGCRDGNRRYRKVSPVDRAERGRGLAYLRKRMKHSPGAVEPLLQDDIAAVMTTKLTMSAAPGIPILLKTRTNGLICGSS